MANLVNRSERQGASAKWGYAILPLMGLAAMARCAAVISLLGSVQGFRCLPRTISPMCFKLSDVGPNLIHRGADSLGNFCVLNAGIVMQLRQHSGNARGAENV